MASRMTLMIARMDPQHATAVAALFAESDATELPLRMGVRRRTLFHFNGIYAHLIEASGEIEQNIAWARVRSPLFRDVSRKLDEYITPYSPATWTGPLDSRSTPFYSWHSPGNARFACEPEAEGLQT